MDYSIESWKCVEIIHGAEKQESVESTRRAAFDYPTYDDGRLGQDIVDGGADATNRAEKQGNKESESRA